MRRFVIFMNGCFPLLLCVPVLAQSSENYLLHASAFTSGGGRMSSENYRNHDAAVGQAGVGDASGVSYDVEAGFVNNQVFDFSPPSTPVVTDGGEETTDQSQLCASWVTSDLESGIFDNFVGLGTSAGSNDVRASSPVGATSSACLSGPFDRCEIYYFNVRSRNGSHLLSAVGSSDGIFLDDPLDVPDGDGLGNECDSDDDEDGTPDASDPCPCDPKDDEDGDGLCANHPLCALETDNCPTIPNPSQADSDGDGEGDACEQVCVRHVPGDDPLIQESINLATPGCTILVAAGTYTEDLVIDKVLKLEGEDGADATTLEGGGALPVIEVVETNGTSAVTIRGFTILGGTEGVFTVSNTDLVESVVDGASRGVVSELPIVGSAPEVTIRSTTIKYTTTGVESRVGSITLTKSWVKDSSGNGVVATDGCVHLVDTLVTDNVGACLRIGPNGCATVDFSTITACARGIELLNSAASALRLDDSIVWGNTDDLAGVNCSAVAYTDTEPACCSMNGNICADPLFVDPEARDYHLPLSSPAVDAAFEPESYTGDPCLDHFNSADIHKQRLLDADGNLLAHPDMGAYELDKSSTQIPGDVQRLRWTDDDRIFEWDSEPNSTSYNVYRGTLASLGYDNWGTCRGTTTSTDFFDSESPGAPGEGFFYIVSGEGSSREGTKGYGTCAERSTPLPGTPPCD